MVFCALPVVVTAKDTAKKINLPGVTVALINTITTRLAQQDARVSALEVPKQGWAGGRRGLPAKMGKSFKNPNNNKKGKQIKEQQVDTCDEKQERVGSRLGCEICWAGPADWAGQEEDAPSLTCLRPDALIDWQRSQLGVGQAELPPQTGQLG